MFEKLGKFEIKRVLGNGAMGEVYLGVDPSIGREVAIKTILPAAAQGGDAKERFAREARAAGVLNHPNLVTIYEFGEDQGVLYIAMEFVKGHDLEELLQEQSITRSEALEILAQVCDGLGFAHRQHIVHRDIKPSNVRVQRDGRRLIAKVMDFGVAKISNSDMTATGMVMGTVSYMAPEYIRTGKPDPRSDLFAVGVMLYECLSGRKPFSGDTTPTVLYKIVNEEPEPIDTERLQGISPAIRAVLSRSLSKNPDERFQTAEDLAKTLRAAKDPSWVGQVEESTTLLKATSAPTAPAIPAASSPTIQQAMVQTAPAAVTAGAQIPTITPSTSSRKGLWIGLAALLLVAVGAGSWAFLKHGVTTATPASAAALDASKETAPGMSPQSSPRTASGNQNLSSGKTSVPGGPNTTLPQGSTSGNTTLQAPSQTESTRPSGSEPRAKEAKAIDQPELYKPERLDNLEVHERLNLGNVSIGEAINLVDSNPEKAIHGFRLAIKADPYNVKAHAWLAVVLHDQGRMGEFFQELREGRQQGILQQMINQNIRLKMAFSKERLNRKLPSDLAY